MPFASLAPKQFCRLVLFALPLAAAGAWGVDLAHDRRKQAAVEPMQVQIDPQRVMLAFRVAFDVPGISLPPATPAASSKLGDDEPVVGVSLHGVKRAYPVREMHGTMRHVVNDLLAAMPISMTYCDRTDCVRAFIGSEGEPPLELRLGGIHDGEMVLVAAGHRYLQQSLEPLSPEAPAFPYAELAVRRTTWGRWRREHPQTDVVVNLRHPQLPGADSAGPRPAAVLPAGEAGSDTAGGLSSRSAAPHGAG